MKNLKLITLTIATLVLTLFSCSKDNLPTPSQKPSPVINQAVSCVLKTNDSASKGNVNVYFNTNIVAMCVVKDTVNIDSNTVNFVYGTVYNVTYKRKLDDSILHTAEITFDYSGNFLIINQSSYTFTIEVIGSDMIFKIVEE